MTDIKMNLTVDRNKIRQLNKRTLATIYASTHNGPNGVAHIDYSISSTVKGFFQINHGTGDVLVNGDFFDGYRNGER